MINVADTINEPGFTETIVIERVTGAQTIDGMEIPGTTSTLKMNGVCVSPKGTKSITLTPKGSKAAGYINIYVDASHDLYTTDQSDGNTTSDTVYRNYQQPNQEIYRIIYVNDYKRHGYVMAEAERIGGA